MLRDLLSGKDDQAEAALRVIAAADADVLVLMDVDWDHGGLGLAALERRLADLGQAYPHTLALRPNSGMPSGVDLDGDGTTHEARDAMGYGWFTGDSGLAILSRVPLGEVRDESAVIWSTRSDAADLLPEAARATVPLATTAQWIVPLRLSTGTATLITLSAGTPVFDGPEDRNGLRNRDELVFVTEQAAIGPNPIVMGRANQDPDRGEGIRDALRALLDLPTLQDPVPRAPNGTDDTVAWDGPGPMRVDYVLPPRAWTVTASGVIWPDPDDALRELVEEAGNARLVWVEVAVP